MSRYRLVLMLICVVGIPLIAYNLWQRQRNVEADKNQAELVKELGSHGLETVRLADKVLAFRIEPSAQTRRGDIESYTVTAGPIEVAPDVQRKLQRLLTNQESYGWGYKKACSPTHGVRLSFVRDAEQVDVNLCFDCGIALFVQNDEVTGGANFDPSQPALAGFAKSFFPDDAAIQKIR